LLIIMPRQRQTSSSSSSKKEIDSDEEKNSRRLNEETERRFIQILHNFHGLVMHPSLPDGNCLFRSVADQMYGDQSFHDIVREATMNWMTKERDHYSQYISEDFEDYIARKRIEKVFGNHLELQAISELYNRRIEVFDVEEFVRKPDSKPKNLFQNDYKGAPIRLSYHNRNHYNSIVDPNDPRIGEGLLPGFKTREQIEADLLKRVKEISERDDVEKELGRVAEEESIREDEEKFLREIEERQVRELLANTRPQDLWECDEYDYASSETEEQVLERVKWQSLRDQ